MASALIPLFIIAYGLFIVALVGDCQNVLMPKVNFGSFGRKRNISEVPLRIPGQCPDHMRWFPSPNNKSSWVCDCITGYVYVPANDSCHKPYRRGPCKPNQYVVMPMEKTVAMCEVNPCKVDGIVPFNGSCYPVESKDGPCGDNILTVNETTFQFECIPVDLAPFLIIDAPSKDEGCPPGSRRTAQGLCRRPL